MKIYAFLLMVMVTFPCVGDVTEEESLLGLKEIQLVVEELPPAASGLKLSKGLLELEVTKQLQESDFKLLSLEERIESPQQPYIYINCNLLYIEKLDLTSYSIDVEVHQRVTLETGEKAQGLTWAKSYLGIASGGIVSDRVREKVERYVAEFIKAATGSKKAKSA